LSPSTLNLFRDCPRCFWLEKVKGIRRPRGIFPSLPGGMDRVIKTYFDKFRAEASMPPELQVDAFKGLSLFGDQKKLDLWREWRTGLRFTDKDKSILSGALDDLIQDDGRAVPFDYKTKGSPTSADDAQRYYQNQIDCYALLLEQNGFSLAGYGYLLYYSPKSVSEKGWVGFNMQMIRLETDPQRAMKTFRDAVALLKGGIPPVKSGCEYCGWLEKAAGEPACNIGKNSSA